LVPFISHTAGCRCRLPKNVGFAIAVEIAAGRMTCQAAPGLEPTLAPDRMFQAVPSATPRLGRQRSAKNVALPSPLKSPLPIACHDAPDCRQRAAAIRLVPVHEPLGDGAVLSARNVDLPSPLKSAEPISCQSVPGLEATFRPENEAGAAGQQTAGEPSAFCHRMSPWPSPSKSFAGGFGVGAEIGGGLTDAAWWSECC